MTGLSILSELIIYEEFITFKKVFIKSLFMFLMT